MKILLLVSVLLSLRAFVQTFDARMAELRVLSIHSAIISGKLQVFTSTIGTRDVLCEEKKLLYPKTELFL